ncbi:MAG: response regulator [Rikenellaceae bacterium]
MLRFSIIVALCTVATHLYGSGNSALRFHHIDISNGILHNNVSSLAQDDKGYIWIGTQQGLNCFDGNKVDSYVDHGELDISSYNNIIRAICSVDSLICLSTHNGLRGFNVNTKEFFDFANSNIESNPQRRVIRNMHIDSLKNLWVMGDRCVECLRIVHINGRYILSPIPIDNKKTLPSLVSNIIEITEGTYLLQTQQGYRLLTLVDNQRIESRPIECQITHSGYNYPLMVDGKLWVFTIDALYKYNIDSERLTLLSCTPYQSRRIVGAAVNDQSVWVASNRGLFSVDPANMEFTHYPNSLSPYSIASDNTSDMLIDKNDNLWVSTWATGISYANIKRQKFNTIRTIVGDGDVNTTPDQFTYTIHEDSQGVIYVGTRDGSIGVVDLDNHKVIRSTRLHQIGNPIITTINSDERYLYITATVDGSFIFRIDKKSFEIEEIYDFGFQNVFSAATDNFNQLWVATVGDGLYCLKLENGKVVDSKHFTSQLSSLTNNFVYSDKEKNEILVSTSQGLNRLMLDRQGNVEKIAIYHHSRINQESLSGHYLWAIAKECDSIYWIATRGQGLNRIVLNDSRAGIINDYKLENFNTEHGAYNDVVEGIIVDQRGDVWCSGNTIARFDYKTKHFYNYFEDDGVQSNQFATGSMAKTRQGVLLFGGTKGLNYFSPFTDKAKDFELTTTRLYINDTPVNPNQYINNQKVINTPIESVDKLQLAYNNNSFALDFSDFTFKQAHISSYRYMLKGYDKQWQEFENNALSIKYKNIPYGKYELLIESEKTPHNYTTIKQLSIEIKAPWHLSNLAIIIYALLATFTLIIIYWYTYRLLKIQNLLKLQEERETLGHKLHEEKLSFFTNIFHELKTPLTLINAGVYRLTKNNKSQESLDDLKIIERNNQRLLNLIGEMMDFQRTSTNAKSIKLSPLNINEFIESNIYENFTPWAQGLGLQLELQAPSEIIEMMIDQECLTKILYNILSNSLKYSNGNGKVSLKYSLGNIKNVKREYFHHISKVDNISKDKQYLIIRIADQGVGISSDELPSVFGRFFATNNKSSDQFSSGIGLALVNSLVAHHNGGLILSSQVGVGTEFIVLLPYQPTEECVKNTTELNITFNAQSYIEKNSSVEVDNKLLDHNTGNESKPCILLVDDTIEILVMLRDYFSNDYNLRFAKNGEEALESCREYLPDLIVSDVMMPKMDGYQFCERIKSNLNSCFIPVILLTACSSAEHKRQGFDIGADYYVEKPFDFDVLESLIKNILKRRSMINSLITTNANDQPKRDTNTSEDGLYSKFIDRLIYIIEKHISEPDFTIDNLCTEVGASRSKLYALIKTKEGISLGDFIKTIRMKRAVQLLETQELTISEVSHAVGINSPPFFTRIFKEYYAVTPSEYHKKINNNK